MRPDLTHECVCVGGDKEGYKQHLSSAASYIIYIQIYYGGVILKEVTTF